MTANGKITAANLSAGVRVLVTVWTFNGITTFRPSTTKVKGALPGRVVGTSRYQGPGGGRRASSFYEITVELDAPVKIGDEAPRTRVLMDGVAPAQTFWIAKKVES
jgi:hypothetical protein